MRDSLQSRQTSVRLAGLASADLVWRVPALTPGDGAGVDIAIAALGVVLGAAEVGALAELSTWLVLGYVAVVLAPQAYPSKLGVPAEEAGFRVLFGVVTVVAAAGIRRGPDGSPLTLLGMLALMWVAGAVLLGYLRWMRGWELSPADDRFVQLIEGVSAGESVDQELRADFSRPGPVGVLGATVARAAAGTILVVPALLAGIVAVVLVLLYPLPDLLVLGWSGLGAVSTVTGREVTPPATTTNIDARLYDIVEEATRSLKGMTIGVYLVVLAFGFGLLFAGALDFGFEIDRTSLWAGPRLVWNLTGFVVVLVASSCYGIWCCVRLARRLPSFLRWYEREMDRPESTTSWQVSDTSTSCRRPERQADVDDSTAPSAGTASRPWCRRRRGVRWFSPARRWWHACHPGGAVGYGEQSGRRAERSDSTADGGEGETDQRRPVGFVGPPLAATALLALALRWFGVDSSAFALSWPVLLLGLAGCVVWTHRAGRRRVRNDDHHVVAGTAGFVLTASLLGSLDAVLGAVRSGLSLPETIPLSVYGAGFVVWIGYIDDAFRYGDSHDDIRRLSKGGYLLACTLVFGLFLPFTSGPYRDLFALLLATTAVGGLSLLVTNWVRL